MNFDTEEDWGWVEARAKEYRQAGVVIGILIGAAAAAVGMLLV